MSETLKDFNKRVTRLADWQLRIRARYEPMNGFAETAGVMHEMLAYIVSLEHQLNTTPQTKHESENRAIPLSGVQVRELMYFRKTIPLVGQHSPDYEDGFWDALELYENAIAERHGIK